MPEPLVLQKLLTAPIAAAIVEAGSDQVGGYVTAASSVAGLRTPADLLAAYGVDANPQFVDVVRFEQPRLAPISTPSDAERPWQTFPNGFLLGESLAPVWNLGRTRYSYGAEYWRIRSDGEQKRLSRYEGAARGWIGARQWRAPSPIVSAMARWQSGEYFADVIGESVLLTMLADYGPAGFEQIHHACGQRQFNCPNAKCSNVSSLQNWTACPCASCPPHEDQPRCSCYPMTRLSPRGLGQDLWSPESTK